MKIVITPRLNMALPSNCPLCFADTDQQSVLTSHVYGGNPNQSFFRCNGCDVIYLFPKLGEEEQKRFYAAEFEGFMASRAGPEGGWKKPQDHILANEGQRLRRMKYIAPHLPKEGGRILEVGCSSGFMLFPLREMGYECIGIEPSGVFSSYLENRQLRCFESVEALGESAEARKGFDLIMHFFVIEHDADPVDFLSQQLALLKESGTLIVEAPNADDPLFTVYDIPQFERFYWSVAHNWYFSQRSFRRLLDKTGTVYEVLLDQRYDLSNHMVWARDGRPGGSGRFTHLLGEELEKQYKSSLIRVGKCDTLVGVLRRG